MASLKGEEITRAILWPGAGVGGHCLTKDTYHLERGVQVLGGSLDWPEGREFLYTLVRGINDFMPQHMVHLTESALAQAGKTLKGSRIALLGWAFINDSDDARNTPAEPFFEAALAAGAEGRVHDPWVDPVLSPDAPPGLSWDLEGVLSGADAVVVFAGHKEYQGLVPERVKALCGCAHPVIVDGRNVVDPDAWIAKGFAYRGIGRGIRITVDSHQPCSGIYLDVVRFLYSAADPRLSHKQTGIVGGDAHIFTHEWLPLHVILANFLIFRLC